MVKYLLGALIGGILGYFVFYKVIGCSSGTCPITANPYISTIYGIVLGVIIAGLIGSLAASRLDETAQAADAEYEIIMAEESDR